MSKDNYHPKDPKDLKFRVTTTRTHNRIITTVDLFGGEEMLSRMSAKVVDLQVEQMEETLNSLGYFRDKPEVIKH